MGAAAIVSLVVEVIGWFALATGLVFLVLALLIRLADGRWLRTDAVVVDGDEGSVIRWFADGAFHSRNLSAEERAHVTHTDEELAYYKEREPHRLRLHEPPAGRRALRMIGFVLLGIAALAAVIGVILMLAG